MMTPLHPAQQICTFLEQEGFKAEIDDDNDLVFPCEGLVYLLCLDQHDLRWGRLVLPFVWELDAGSSRQGELQAVDFVNRRSKLVKAYVEQRRVCLCVQLPIDPCTHWRPMLLRSIRALAEARTLLMSAIRFPEIAAPELACAL